MAIQTLATTADVEARLRRPLTDSEIATVQGLLEEAGVEILEFCGVDSFDPVPDTVRVVASRMVARVFSGSTTVGGVEIPSTASEVDMRASAFQFSGRFDADRSSGGVWLTKADRRKLRRYSIHGGAFSVDLTP
ncbi:head-to-tail adaptor [Gordonia phage Pytheas]|nr:head-to-tail adaptor [Gordonia Phage Jablanski]UYL88037.1 head-to-tail adaptor [Gordonia phage Pytheas]